MPSQLALACSTSRSFPFVAAKITCGPQRFSKGLDFRLAVSAAWLMVFATVIPTSIEIAAATSLAATGVSGFGMRTNYAKPVWRLVGAIR